VIADSRQLGMCERAIVFSINTTIDYIIVYSIINATTHIDAGYTDPATPGRWVPACVKAPILL